MQREIDTLGDSEISSLELPPKSYLSLQGTKAIKSEGILQVDT